MKTSYFIITILCVFSISRMQAQQKIKCKETGFYEKPLKICFMECVQSILEENCGETLKGFYGNVEFKLVISIDKERILGSQLLIHHKNEPLSLKQRMSIKKTLLNIPITFIGKENNTRQALPSYHYKTSWIYSVENGQFKSL